jgi:hypothetical protein
VESTWSWSLCRWLVLSGNYIWRNIECLMRTKYRWIISGIKAYLTSN